MMIIDTTRIVYNLAAVGPAGRRYRSIAARPAVQQHGATAREQQQIAGSATFTAEEYTGS